MQTVPTQNNIPSDECTNLLQLVLYSSHFAKGSGASSLHSLLTDPGVHGRCLCHDLHAEHYKRLFLIPKEIETNVKSRCTRAHTSMSAKFLMGILKV